MTQQIYVRADEYYSNIDHLKDMIEKVINKYVEYPESRDELFKAAFDGVELSVSPSRKAPQVLRLDDGDVVNPEDVVVGIDNCWVKIEDYAADMWAIYTNAYTEIMTSESVRDSVRYSISDKLDFLPYVNEFIDNMSLLDIRRYTEIG